MYTTESKAVERAYTKVVANIAALSKQVAETDDEVSECAGGRLGGGGWASERDIAALSKPVAETHD